MKKLVIIFFLCLAPPAGADPPAAEVRLEDLITEALRHNREILAAQKKVEAAQARRSIASSLPDPTITFGYMNADNPLPFTKIGKDPLSYAGLAFTQELPFAGKLKLRGEVAGKEAEAEFKLYQAAELSLVSRLKQAYYQLHYLTRARETILSNRDLLEKFARIAEARYTVGKGSQQDVLKAQTESTRLETRLARLDQEENVLKAEVNALLDRAPGAPLGRPADYPKATPRYSLEELVARAAEQSPLVGRERAEVEKNTLALNLARRDYYPDFSLMGGYWNYGSFPSMYEMRVEVKVPLYFWRKQRYAVKEQAAAVSQARHQYEATTQALNFRVQQDYLAAKTSERLAALYEKGVLPQATLTLESAIASYEVGAVDFLTLLADLITVLDTQLNYHEEMAAYHKALARLEEATGLRLTE